MTRGNGFLAHGAPTVVAARIVRSTRCRPGRRLQIQAPSWPLALTVKALIQHVDLHGLGRGRAGPRRNIADDLRSAAAQQAPTRCTAGIRGPSAGRASRNPGVAVSGRNSPPMRANGGARGQGCGPGGSETLRPAGRLTWRVERAGWELRRGALGRTKAPACLAEDPCAPRPRWAELSLVCIAISVHVLWRACTD
jgi:hypothetical protein